MSFPTGQEPADEALRQDTADWVARMRGDDADQARDAFERWCAADPRHREAYDRIDRKYAFTEALRHSEMGRDRQLPNGWRQRVTAAPARYALAAAAAVLLIVAGSIAVTHHPVAPDSAAVAATPVSTEVGQIRRQRLTDGSTLTLDTDSQIEIAFRKTARVVRLLRGRVRFDVAPAADRPFVVEAAGRTVTAKGTLFDVCLYGGGFGVSLLQGEIDVARGTALQPPAGAVAHLATGQALRSAGDQAAPEIRPVQHDQEKWVDGMLSFDGTPLGEVLEQTNRYSKSKIRLADPSLGPLRVTGAFRPLPVRKLAAGLAAAFSLRIEQTPSGDIVLHSR